MSNINLSPILLFSGASGFLSPIMETPGIYGISGLAPSRFKVPIYVGSSSDILDRIKNGHISSLENNRHPNKILQNYFNKNGINNITIFLLEKTSSEKEILLKTEQKYIDYYGVVKNEDSFNIAEVAGSPMRGRFHTNEAKEKIGIASTGRKRGAESNKKRVNTIRLNNKIWKGGDYRFISPDGILFEGNNLRSFSKRNNLCHKAISQVNTGKRLYHKGWRKASVEEIENLNKTFEKFKNYRYKEFEFLSPDDKIIKGRNLREFCKENKLSYRKMCRLRQRGKYKCYKGWRILDLKINPSS